MSVDVTKYHVTNMLRDDNRYKAVNRLNSRTETCITTHEMSRDVSTRMSQTLRHTSEDHGTTHVRAGTERRRLGPASASASMEEHDHTVPCAAVHPRYSMQQVRGVGCGIALGACDRTYRIVKHAE